MKRANTRGSRQSTSKGRESSPLHTGQVFTIALCESFETFRFCGFFSSRVLECLRVPECLTFMLHAQSVCQPNVEARESGDDVHQGAQGVKLPPIAGATGAPASSRIRAGSQSGSRLGTGEPTDESFDHTFVSMHVHEIALAEFLSTGLPAVMEDSFEAGEVEVCSSSDTCVHSPTVVLMLRGCVYQCEVVCLRDVSSHASQEEEARDAPKTRASDYSRATTAMPGTPASQLQNKS